MKPFIVIVTLAASSPAFAQELDLGVPDIELSEPELVAERSPDYRARKIAGGLLGFGITLAVPSGTMAALEAAISHRNYAMLATHGVLAAVGTSMVIGGIVRLVRTARNATVDRRRLRRRLIPLVILAALSHSAVTMGSLLATASYGATGYSP